MKNVNGKIAQLIEGKGCTEWPIIPYPSNITRNYSPCVSGYVLRPCTIILRYVLKPQRNNLYNVLSNECWILYTETLILNLILHWYYPKYDSTLWNNLSVNVWRRTSVTLEANVNQEFVCSRVCTKVYRIEIGIIESAFLIFKRWILSYTKCKNDGTS